jgi:hypothetical protein
MYDACEGTVQLCGTPAENTTMILPRRRFLQRAAAVGTAFSGSMAAAADAPAGPLAHVEFTPAAEAQGRAQAARPSRGGLIPADLPRRFGIAHVDPKYGFTPKPILIEGAEKILETPARAAKFWLLDLAGVYRRNSDWQPLRGDSDFVERIQHPYFVATLALPFEMVALEVGSAPGTRMFAPDEDYSRDEQEMYALTRHLLTAYADKPCTFILQNWEGDWIIRGDDKDWAKKVPPHAQARLASMAAWWRARQRGVTRARKEAPPGGKCTVLHAAEVNRVADAFQGIPVATTHALPHAPVDLVSWSCYDGLNDPALAWKCLEVLHACAHDEEGRPAPIMIGEIGRPETGQEEQAVVEWWDQALGVLFAWGVHSIFHWELFCNEPRDASRRKLDLGPKVQPAEMRGFWWFRPDGTTSWGGDYLGRVLSRAGQRGLG